MHIDRFLRPGGVYNFLRGLIFVVIKGILLDLEKPFFVSEKPRHLLRIASEEDEHKVVPVDCVLEKILYFSGNPSHTSVSTAPNFCGHCR